MRMQAVFVTRGTALIARGTALFVARVSAWFAALSLLAGLAIAADESAELKADKAALAPLQAYVGQWRGVGLPKRGSNQGAWTEQAEWAWHFADGRAELVATLEPNKYFQRLQVQPGKVADAYVLLVTPVGADSENAKARFTGKLEEGVLTAVADDAASEGPARITVRLIASGDRMLVLYEKRLAADAFGRLAEVGSTRKGSGFAKSAASGPECVVTGGLGTIAVEHEGKTYYVCCGGCRDLFNDDPAGTLADYRERKAAERAEKKK